MEEAKGGKRPPPMTRPIPLTLGAYAAATRLLAPLAPAWLRHRVRLGKEDPRRWPERLGQAGLLRPPGRLAWLHGVSVGETLSLLPLVARLREERPDVSLLVTSGTRASAELLEARLCGRALHQYAPLDTPGAVARFLDTWKPEIGVFAESELWPNLILGARARGVRLALISGRLSQSSAATWRRAPAAVRALLGAFDLILAADTLCYFGDLAPVFAACRRALSGDGVFAFTVETFDGEGFRLLPGLRFAHARPHVEDAARAAGLRVACLRRAWARREADAEAPGLAGALEPA